MTPTYRKSFVIALTGHVVLIIAVVVASVLPGCQRTKIIDLPVDFMIVPPKTDTPLMRKDPPPEHPVPPPPGLPDQPHNPVMPVDPLPPKPPDKIPDKAPDKIPDKQPVVKPATNSVPHVATNNTSVHVTVSTNHVIKIGPHVSGPGESPHKQQKLSTGEWERMMGVNAPIGDHDSLPMDERQRCLLLIKQALYDAWNQPAVADAGSRPAELEIRFDLSGRVVGYHITQSSGSDVCDRSVTQAAASVLRVEGLTARFLRDYSRLTIDFKLTE